MALPLTPRNQQKAAQHMHGLAMGVSAPGQRSGRPHHSAAGPLLRSGAGAGGIRPRGPQRTQLAIVGGEVGRVCRLEGLPGAQRGTLAVAEGHRHLVVQDADLQAGHGRAAHRSLLGV